MKTAPITYYVLIANDCIKWGGDFSLAEIYDSLPPIGFSYRAFEAAFRSFVNA